MFILKRLIAKILWDYQQLYNSLSQSQSSINHIFEIFENNTCKIYGEYKKFLMTHESILAFNVDQ